MSVSCLVFVLGSLAARTKSHRLHGFDNRGLFFSCLQRLESPRSGSDRVQLLVRAHFLPGRGPPFHCGLTHVVGEWQRGRTCAELADAGVSSSYKGSTPIRLEPHPSDFAKPLSLPPKPHLQIASYWGLGLQHVAGEETPLLLRHHVLLSP